MGGMRAPVVAALCVIAAVPALPRAGDVRGWVGFHGAAPPPRTLEVTKDRSVCGDSAPDESLLVSEGGLANAVVRIVVPGARLEPARVTLDQRGCRFAPHVVAAPVGSTLDLLNGDALLHGVHGWTGPATAFNVPMAFQGEKQPQPLARPGPIRVGCDVHPWMSAWILVVDVPYYAVSDARGRFEIAGVPPGTFTAIAWHERLGEKIGTVKVPEAGAAKLELTYP
jgi:plastocyanin